jgi:hypothetical protein
MQIKTKCSKCGTAMVLDVPEAFKDAGIAGVTCQACADKQVHTEGGTVLDLAPVSGALFNLGHVRVTAGAVQALAESGQDATEFLARHARGDWGKNGRAGTIPVTEDEVRAGPFCTEESDKSNQLTLLCGTGVILSEYTTSKGTRLWCHTDRLPRAGSKPV